MTPRPYVRLLCAAAVILLSPGCAYYSFTGATIPEHLNTVAIPMAEDLTSSPITDLDAILTRNLVDRFVGQTRLQLETDESSADALLTVDIQRYVIEPAAVGGEDRATLNRLTISVLANYLDRAENNELFERTFTSSVEFDPSNLADEEIAAAEVLDNIADDIFTSATSNW